MSLQNPRKKTPTTTTNKQNKTKQQTLLFPKTKLFLYYTPKSSTYTLKC
jgi:hypothetical protein